MIPKTVASVAAMALGAGAGICGYTAAAGVTGWWPAAALAAVAACALVVRMARRPGAIPLEPAAWTRPLLFVSGAAALGALLALGRLAVFILDPAQAGFSNIPSSSWELRHSCLSAYYVAATTASTMPDIYEPDLFNLPGDDGTGVRKARALGPFKIDVYEYPPPFLLLPRLLMLAAPGFLELRMLWFALSGITLGIALVTAARWLGPEAGTRALLLSPLVLLAIPTLSTLQKGNVQVLIIAGSMLAMACFERGRWAAGGALLAFATVSKLYPGLLLVYLLARRQWRAVGWTAAMGVAFALATLLDIGWAPHAHFLEHLPGLLGGEAFPAFRNPAAMAINFSIPGLVFKLGLLGVPGMTFTAAKLLGWIYTLAVLAVIVHAARRAPSDDEKPLIWLGILILATLRSPFLPQAYGALPTLWMVTLLAARYAPTVKTLVLVALAWGAMNIYWPLDFPANPAVLALASGIPQAITIALGMMAVLRAPIAVPAASTAPLRAEAESA